MICPYLINASLLIGSLISWGVLWPWIKNKKGAWYDATLPESSLSGLTGYKVQILASAIRCIRSNFRQFFLKKD